MLLIHHAGKGGDQRGASRLEDFLDTTIKLLAVPREEAQEEGACFDWYFTKTRGGPVKPDRLRLTLAQRSDGILFWRYGNAPELRPHHQTLRTIYFGPNGDRSSTFERQMDLADSTALQEGTISKHLKALRREGLLSAKGIERLRRFFPEDFDS